MRTMTLAEFKHLTTLRVTSPVPHVAQVELNRPQKRNAMNKAFWVEIADCFHALGKNTQYRTIILSGAGKMFTSGLDLFDHTGELAPSDGAELDASRRAWQTQQFLTVAQRAFTAIEEVPQPVIAAIHNACVGGGVDMVCACDIRLCSEDAWFTVKEVDIGLAADVGTLQRLPKIIGNQSFVRDVCYTARNWGSSEAKAVGFVSGVYKDREALLAEALKLASTIAAKSPVAVAGTKVNLLYARDHSVEDGLRFMRAWNGAMLQTKDIPVAIQASMAKETPIFAKL